MTRREAQKQAEREHRVFAPVNRKRGFRVSEDGKYILWEDGSTIVCNAEFDQAWGQKRWEVRDLKGKEQ